MVGSLDRDELSALDLLSSTSRLFEEVRVAGRHADQTAHVPLAKAPAHGSPSDRGAPCGAYRRGVTGQVLGPDRIRVSTGDRLECFDEGTDPLLV
jgi:hypothetical protein